MSPRGENGKSLGEEPAPGKMSQGEGAQSSQGESLKQREGQVCLRNFKQAGFTAMGSGVQKGYSWKGVRGKTGES